MKHFTHLFLICSFSTGIHAQITQELQAVSEGNSQLTFRSNDGTEIFGFRMDDDGELQLMANGSNRVVHINDEEPNAGFGINWHSSITLRAQRNEPNSEGWGLFGLSNGNGTGPRYGVSGWATNGNDNRYGVRGYAGIAANGHWGVYCSGNLWYSGALTSASDGRFKSDIQDFKSALNMVQKLRPRTYHHKTNIKHLALAEGPQYGFVAQELEKVLPDLVQTSLHDFYEDDSLTEHQQVEIKGINYIGLIPILTKAIQEQQEIIRAQQQIIEQHEERLLALEKK